MKPKESNAQLPPGQKIGAPNLLLIAPPGAGKDSMVSTLLSVLNLEHVSSGEIFRAEIARGTPHGKTFASAHREWDMLSDNFTLQVMRKWYFARGRSRAFLLDGFPRNCLQAKVFDEWIEQRSEPLAAALYLDLSLGESIRRLSQRRVCPGDGTVYNLAFYPPNIDGRCDKCGNPIMQRDDDREETLRFRWRLFEKHTFPMVDYYRRQGLLISFDASIQGDDSRAEVIDAIRRRFN